MTTESWDEGIARLDEYLARFREQVDGMAATNTLMADETEMMRRKLQERMDALKSMRSRRRADGNDGNNGNNEQME